MLDMSSSLYLSLLLGCYSNAIGNAAEMRVMIVGKIVRMYEHTLTILSKSISIHHWSVEHAEFLDGHMIGFPSTCGHQMTWLPVVSDARRLQGYQLCQVVSNKTMIQWIYIDTSYPMPDYRPFNLDQRKVRSETMEELLMETTRRATSYLKGINTRGVVPTPEAIAHLSKFDEPIPEGPTDPFAVLDLLDTYGSPATVGSAGGRYFGFVTGGSLPAALAANWMAGAWDQNAAFYVMSPIAATLETISLRWLLDVLHLPADAGGAFVTGATMANFTALAAARHRVLADAGWDVEADGLFGAPPVTLIVGEEVHPSLLKALGMLGFGRQRVTRVPVDNQGRMRSDAFPQIQGPTIVCLQAGNVNTGAFDPAQQIIPRARQAKAWVHVDGAFGLWAAASPTYAHLTEGYSEADSWATDAHKWLNVPYDSGLVFVRDTESLRAAMSINASYLPQGAQREPSQFTPEASRRARGIEIWAALRSLGRTGLAELIERDCHHAQQAAQRFQQAGIEVLNDVVLNQVLVSFGTDAAGTKHIIEEIQRTGVCWTGPTIWQSHPAMRLSVSSWATTDDDRERSVEAIIRIATSKR